MKILLRYLQQLSLGIVLLKVSEFCLKQKINNMLQDTSIFLLSVKIISVNYFMLYLSINSLNVGYCFSQKTVAVSKSNRKDRFIFRDIFREVVKNKKVCGKKQVFCV